MASVPPVKTSGFKPIAPNGPVPVVVTPPTAGSSSGSSSAGSAAGVLVDGAASVTADNAALLLLKLPTGEVIKLSNLPLVKDESDTGLVVSPPSQLLQQPGLAQATSQTKLKLKETLINNSSSAAFASKRNNAKVFIFYFRMMVWPIFSMD